MEKIINTSSFNGFLKMLDERKSYLTPQEFIDVVKEYAKTNKFTRREFLEICKVGGIAFVAACAMIKFGIKADAATSKVSFENLYKSFVDAFSDGIVSTSENIYGIQVTMGPVEQFDITYNGQKFIYNYYAECIKNKKMGELFKYYNDAEQQDFLRKCEDKLFELSKDPENKKKATDFLNFVKDNILIKVNKTVEGDFAKFDPHYFKNVALFETVCEMVQVAWELKDSKGNKKIPAITTLRHDTHPENMNDTTGYWCAQVIIDECAGRSDTSDRNGHPKHSGITKGNTQFEELIMLNYYAPNDEIKKMVMRSLYLFYEKQEMCEVLNMSGAKYDELMKACGLSQINGIDAENGINSIESSLLKNAYIAVVGGEFPKVNYTGELDYDKMYLKVKKAALLILENCIKLKNNNEIVSYKENEFACSEIKSDVDIYEETKSNSRTRKIA